MTCFGASRFKQQKFLGCVYSNPLLLKLFKNLGAVHRLSYDHEPCLCVWFETVSVLTRVGLPQPSQRFHRCSICRKLTWERFNLARNSIHHQKRENLQKSVWKCPCRTCLGAPQCTVLRKRLHLQMMVAGSPSNHLPRMAANLHINQMLRRGEGGGAAVGLPGGPPWTGANVESCRRFTPGGGAEPQKPI